MATASTYALIQRITVPTPTAAITFSSIPATFTDLKIVASSRNSGDSVTLNLTLNGDTGSNYSYKRLIGLGSSTPSSDSSSSAANVSVYGSNASSFTTNVFSNTEFYIPNYGSANYKSISVDTVTENNATAGYINLVAGLWSSTAAITSVTLTAPVSFTINSTFSLYGVGAVGTTPGTPKALGGDIVTSDGTYWYHAFLNSGQFTPSASLTCDYLVVAGGGSGGYTGGGGGAGGFRAVASQSLSAQSYPVLIGAGGAVGGYNPRVDGSNGSDSIFNTFTSTGGGRAATGNYAASTGGSGGGGSATGWGGGYTSGAAGNTPATSPAQGFAGGTGGSGSDYVGGGGGGASAVGTNSSGATPGVGGAGANSYNSITVTSWLTATNTGVSGYLAGGGGGGNGGAGGSGGGGAGATGDNFGVSGRTNSGSGGGGSRVTTGTANTGGSGGGGSGLIIIRYTI